MTRILSGLYMLGCGGLFCYGAGQIQPGAGLMAISALCAAYFMVETLKPYLRALQGLSLILCEKELAGQFAGVMRRIAEEKEQDDDEDKRVK